ncbi:MAG TPA: membrane protein insertase YidC, partial [Candidatus Deferrimicrobiaceae bacterium]
MILAIALSIAVLLGYQYLFPPPPQRAAQNAAAPSKDNAAGTVAGTPAATSQAAGSAAVAAPGTAAAAVAVPAAPVRVIRIQTPLYTAALSTDGGTLTSFRLERYMDRQGPDGKPLDIVNASPELPAPLALAFGQSQPALP